MSVDNIKIQINVGNDAFQPAPEPELARILRKLADAIEASGDIENVTAPLYDINGGFVGYLTVYGGDDE